MLEFGPSIQTTPALSCSHEHCTQSNLNQPTDIITFPSCIFRPKLSWSTTHVEPSCLVYKATEIACRPKRKERTFDCHVPRKVLTLSKVQMVVKWEIAASFHWTLFPLLECASNAKATINAASLIQCTLILINYSIHGIF